MGCYCNYILALGAIGLAAALFAYKTNHVFRYYVKHLLFAWGAMMSATMYVPIMLHRPRDARNGLLPAWTLKKIGNAMGVEWEIRGHENLVKDSGSVIVMNHQSILDLMIFGEIWKLLDKGTVIAKKELLIYFFPFGVAIWLWGTIFIDRLNAEKAMKTINKTAKTIRDEKRKLCMFPEGTRHGGSELLPFKKGAFHVAIDAQCPIQPMVISRYYFMDAKNKIFDDGKVVLTILPPIPTEGMSKNDVNSLIDQTWNLMNKKYVELSAEVLEANRPKAKEE